MKCTNLLDRSLAQQYLLVSHYSYHHWDNNDLSDNEAFSLCLGDNKSQPDTELGFWLPDSRNQQYISSAVQFHWGKMSHSSMVYKTQTCSDSSYQRDRYDNQKFRDHLFRFGMFLQGIALQSKPLRYRNDQQDMGSEYSPQYL